MPKMVDIVAQLPREKIFEAIIALQSDERLNTDRDSASMNILPIEWIEQPYKSINEIESLARLALLTALEDERWSERVSSAIEGSGRKNFIFGGAEIGIAAKLGLLILVLLIPSRAKGKLHIERKADGAQSIQLEYDTRWPISDKLGEVLDKLKSGG